MDKNKKIKESFINNFHIFENKLNGESKGDFHKTRNDAFKNFTNLDFPNSKNEEWKYTNIAPLLSQIFSIDKVDSKISKDDIKKYLLEGIDAHILVFINGDFSSELSLLKDINKGIRIDSIKDKLKNNDSELLNHLGKYADYRKDIFTSLSTAFTNDGAFIKVDDNIISEKPFYILYLTNAQNNSIQTQPRNLILGGKNSQFTIIEHFVSIDDSTYFTNTITEVLAEENSVIDHIKIQEESRNAFHFARMDVEQERNSNFTSHLISLGGKISRNEMNAKFNNEGGESMLNGLFLIEDDQLFDVHSKIDHAKPHCNSHEHYKGILDDASRGVFNGKIMVRKDAQKTNAFQQNNNILLSKEALINTKPQLEIFADDVKCSHGATIGQLDKEAKFYLKSRGIGEEAANIILLHAFASDVINLIKVDAVKNYAEEIITKRINERIKEN